MKLATKKVSPGEWIIIEGGAPTPNDLSPQYVTIDGKRYSAYVDQKDLRLRCPNLDTKSPVNVSIRGFPLGTIQLLA